MPTHSPRRRPKRMAASSSRQSQEFPTKVGQTLVLAPEEQLAFWNGLQAKPELTNAQLQLGAIMRGEE